MQSVTTDCINEHLERRMTEAEAYGEVIDMIVEDRLDYKKIALALAKKAPKVLLGIVGEVGKAPAKSGNAMQELMTEAHRRLAAAIDPFLITNNKVSAIKAVRELTAWGLKEAKDYVDFYQDPGSMKPDLRSYANPAWLSKLATDMAAAAPVPTKRVPADDSEDMDALLKDLTAAMSPDPEDRYEAGGAFA